MQRVASPLWLKALDHFFLTRPMLMPPVWTISLLGYGQAQQQVTVADWSSVLYPIAVFTLLTGGVYVQNQIYDIEGDRANNKLFLLTDGYISIRAANVQTMICYGGAIILAFLHSVWLGVLMSLALVFGNQYNIPPFRWKDRPIAGMLYNIFIYGVLTFAVGWMAVALPDREMLLRTIPYCLGVGAIYLNTTLPDIPGDRAAGKITIGVKYGFKPAATLACFMLAGAVATGWWFEDPYIAVPSFLALPLFIRMPFTGHVDDVARATKVGVLVLALAAVVVCPPYLGLLIVLFFGCRPYYRYRFGITYPSFQVQK